MKFVKFTSLLLALLLCVAPAFAEEDNTFTIATNAEFAPWEMVGEGGEYVGIDMDLARLIAEELGMELVIENVDFNSVVNMVVTGKADAAIAGLTITPEREEEVLFSIPYATAVQSVIVREGYEEIATLDDLVGKIVGVQMSTTGDLFVSEMEGVEVRQYSSGTNAAMDLAALLDAPVTIAPRALVNIPTGLAIALPDAGWVALVFARSGLGIKHGIALSNGVGVIDSDYRGELRVGLTNLSDTPYTVQPGDRVAQLMVVPVARACVLELDELPATQRGAGGFGSTGK